jgi:ELWxxDGT repeat protein
VTDGTASGTRLVADIAAGPAGSYPSWLTRLSDGRLAFVTTDGSGRFEPHVSDGTAIGTRRIAVGGPNGSRPRDLGATDDGRFMFVADNSVAPTRHKASRPGIPAAQPSRSPHPSRP